MNFSLTQGGNLVALAGLASELLKLAGVNILPGEIEKVFIAVGLVISWYGRWRKGDLKLSGFRKS